MLSYSDRERDRISDQCSQTPGKPRERAGQQWREDRKWSRPFGAKPSSPCSKVCRSVPILQYLEEVATLAREIAGPAATAEIREFARQVAEAQIDLRRVRYARRQLFSDALANPYYKSRADTRAKLNFIKQLLTPKLAEVPVPDFIEKYLTTAPEGPAKLATILSNETMQLLAFDRYERRAMSRRKFAIRALDEARQRHQYD